MYWRNAPSLQVLHTAVIEFARLPQELPESSSPGGEKVVKIIAMPVQSPDNLSGIPCQVGKDAIADTKGTQGWLGL